MDPLSVQGAISGLRTAAEITRALLSMKVTAEVQAKVIELQSALLEAHQGALDATATQYELREKVRELEARLAARADWEAISKRYVLVNPWDGPAQVYALRREASDGEPAHFCCTYCFSRETKVMLIAGYRGGMAIFQCPSCKASVDTGYSGVGAVQYSEHYVRAG